MAAILNLDVLNLYGRTRDFSALGLDQSSLGAAIDQAAAAEGLKVTTNQEALLRGAYFRSDHFSLARAGVPGTSLESGSDFVGRPAGWGKEQQDLYIAKRYHQPSDQVQPWFTYDGALQQLRVIVRTAVLVGNARRTSLTGTPARSSARPARPAWQLEPGSAHGRRELWRRRPTARRAAPPIFPAAYALPPSPGAFLELPNQHRIPLTWLLENAGPSIRYRTLTELAPAGYASPGGDRGRPHGGGRVEGRAGGSQEAEGHRRLGREPAGPGRVGGAGHQGRRDHSPVPPAAAARAGRAPSRPFKLGDRVLFRLLSRDEDPALLFEFQKTGQVRRGGGGLGARDHARGRLRGAGRGGLRRRPPAPRRRPQDRQRHLAVSPEPAGREAVRQVRASRSCSIPRPIRRAGIRWRCCPSCPTCSASAPASPSGWGTTSRSRRPRRPSSSRSGKRTVKPQHLLLGDPIDADAKGQPTDMPLALHYIELMARMGALPWAPVASKVLGRLLKDCDELGVWRPKNLRSQPKAINKITYHYYPLQADAKTTEGREVDVTFRLALIAKLLGLVARLRLSCRQSALREAA